jgi:hypothetical protein
MAALLTSLKGLFKEAYIKNWQLENDPATAEDIATLEDLDGEELIENLRILVFELLDFKRELKTTERADLYARNEQFESMLQKLEADVRGHIRVSARQLEHQLQLHIDGLTAKQTEVIKAKENAEQSVSELRQLLALKDKEISRFKAETVDTDSSKTDDATKDRSFIGRAKSKGRTKLEKEVTRLRGLLEDKSRDILRLKRLYPSQTQLGSVSDLGDQRGRSAEKRNSVDRSQKTERRVLQRDLEPQRSFAVLENRTNLGGGKKVPRMSSIVKGKPGQKPGHYRCKSDV